MTDEYVIKELHKFFNITYAHRKFALFEFSPKEILFLIKLIRKSYGAVEIIMNLCDTNDKLAKNLKIDHLYQIKNFFEIKRILSE